MTKFFLGVDGGGSQARVAIIDQVEKVISTQPGAGVNVHVLGFDQAFVNLKETIAQVLGNLRYDALFGCFALAGVNFPKEKEDWQQAIAKDQFLASSFSKPPLIVNDTLAALQAGTTEKNAIVVISGTGSHCYGQNEADDEAKAGGLDYILTDQGSGFWLGNEILRAVTCALDGRSKPTVLTDLVFAKFHINSLEELYNLVYQKPWDKTDIAQLAFLAEEAAKDNDQKALEIINQAADDLSTMAKAVIEKLNLVNKNLVIVKAGSILKLEGLICKRFEDNIKKLAPTAVIVNQEIEPAVAAAKIAYEHFPN